MNTFFNNTIKSDLKIPKLFFNKKNLLYPSLKPEVSVIMNFSVI